MACAHVPLDEQQVTEPGPLGREVTLPALVSQRINSYIFSDSCTVKHQH